MSSLSQLGQQLNGFVDTVERNFRYAVEAMAYDIERESVEIIREMIRTTPSGIVEGKPNRIWTGAMHDNVKSRLAKAGNNYRIEYGWFGFVNPESPGSYVSLQELGGGHVETGMHSFSAVQRRVRDILYDYQKGTYFGYF